VHLSLAEIVDALGGDLVGAPSMFIEGLAPLESAQACHIAFLSNSKYQSQLRSTQAGCVIVSPAMKEHASPDLSLIVTNNPYLYFARLTQLWKRKFRSPRFPGVHPSAVVDASAEVDPTASIGPLCVVERAPG